MAQHTDAGGIRQSLIQHFPAQQIIYANQPLHQTRQTLLIFIPLTSN